MSVIPLAFAPFVPETNMPARAPPIPATGPLKITFSAQRPTTLTLSTVRSTTSGYVPDSTAMMSPGFAFAIACASV